MKVKFIALLFLMLSSFTVHANDNAINGQKGDLSKKLRVLVPQYMEQVFGIRVPTIEDYYKYEGSHSEEEYAMEIGECKKRWGNLQNLDDRAYLLNLPKECVDWLVERHRNRDKEPSLYYQSIRNRFNKFPLNYKITCVKEKDLRYHVTVNMPDDRVDIMLDVYDFNASSSYPEIIVIEINDVRNAK